LVIVKENFEGGAFRLRATHPAIGGRSGVQRFANIVSRSIFVRPTRAPLPTAAYIGRLIGG